MRYRSETLLGLLCGVSALSLSSAAFAQDPGAQDPGPEVDEVEEIVVTGSRLPSGFDAPTPVSVVDSETLQATAPNNIGEALGQLPSLSGSTQNTTSAIGSGVGQTNGQNLLDLRRLGSERTLILLDGQRLGVTNVVGSVDINVIPQSLVRRVDVVTGGASASYGSDAVAGVVNFILDTNFEGFKFDVSGGITAQDDVPNGKLSLAYGRQLGSRGRMVAAAEYFKLTGIQYGENTGRDWFDNPTTSVRNAAGAQPTWLLIPNARARFGTYGGQITAVQGCSTAACNALSGQQFLPGGALGPFTPGTNAFGNNAYVTGGDGALVNQAFTPDAERKSLFLHAEYDVNDHVTLWAQGSYNASETHASPQVLQTQTTSQFRIYEDNPFLNPAITAALALDPGVDTFSVTRYSRDMGFNEVSGNVYVNRYAVGAKGRINDSWSYDVILGYQDTHQDLDIRTAIVRNLYAATDVVRNPVTGAIVCRSQFYNGNTFVAGGTGMDPGCVPLNIFGDGAASAEATNFVMGWNTADVELKQATADVNLRGDFGEKLQLGAGPISFATGFNYRRLTAERTVDPLSAILKDGTGIRSYPTTLQGSFGGYTYYNPSPVDGSVSVTEAYGELGVPLLADMPLVQELSATVAGRVTDYSQSGVVTTWKAGINWTINDSLRFRGTTSADIRAPSVIELFNKAQVTRGVYTFPFSSAVTTITGTGQNIQTGNPELQPEEARTYVLGAVFSPTFAQRFQASIDYYRINLENSIAAPGQQPIIDRCAAGDAFSCSLILVNNLPITNTNLITATDFVQVTNPLLNEAAAHETSGLDIEVSYRVPLAGRDLTLRLSGDYLLSDNDPGNTCAAGSRGQTSDLVGTIGLCADNPEIRGRVSARYDIGRFGLFVQQRYIDGGVRNPNFATGIDITVNEVPEVWYTDFTVSYDLGSVLNAETSEAYLNVTNLFDESPPPLNSAAGRSWVEPTDLSLYDALGLRFVVGVRMRW